MSDALPPLSHNYPDLPSLSHEEITYVEAAREALVTIKRTFEFWVVIARGLRALKDKAERLGGRFTFDRLREREGLGGRDKQGRDILNKTRVSRLLAILEPLSEVEKWRAEKLTDKQRFEWASPEAVWRHCPVFANPKAEDANKAEAEVKMSPVALLKQEIAQLKARQADGSLFDLKADEVKDIAQVIVANISEHKANALASAIAAAVKDRRRKRQTPAG
jgi:hypothetical protein